MSPRFTSKLFEAQQLTKTQSTLSLNHLPNLLSAMMEEDVKLASGSLRVGLIETPATPAGKPKTLAKVLPTQKTKTAPYPAR